jgi:CDP-glycerol glycerophosphotransferase (TagB/SpsB family)
VNKILIEALKKKNSILYFSIHHKVKEYNQYKNKFLNNQVIKFVKIKEISECLSKTSLVVTDFSSVIFDLIYKRKPYILYIPDANDPYIEDIYINHYYELIQSMKNGTIFFENLFFDINETINKIIFYLNNNFTLDIKLIKFYDNLGIKSDNNIDKFIKYIINLN